jgi:hypothetical protein
VPASVARTEPTDRHLAACRAAAHRRFDEILLQPSVSRQDWRRLDLAKFALREALASGDAAAAEAWFATRMFRPNEQVLRWPLLEYAAEGKNEACVDLAIHYGCVPRGHRNDIALKVYKRFGLPLLRRLIDAGLDPLAQRDGTSLVHELEAANEADQAKILDALHHWVLLRKSQKAIDSRAWSLFFQISHHYAPDAHSGVAFNPRVFATPGSGTPSFEAIATYLRGTFVHQATHLMDAIFDHLCAGAFGPPLQAAAALRDALPVEEKQDGLSEGAQRIRMNFLLRLQRVDTSKSVDVKRVLHAGM